MGTLIGFDPALKDRKHKEGTGTYNDTTQFSTTDLTGLMVGNLTTEENITETYNLTHFKRIIPSPIAVKHNKKQEPFSKLTYIQVHINPSKIECRCSHNNCRHQQCGQCNYNIVERENQRNMESMEHYCKFNKFEAILDSGSTPNIIKTASLLHVFPEAQLENIDNVCITTNGGDMKIKNSIILDVTMKNDSELIKF